jgi:deoxyribonuclease V
MADPWPESIAALEDLQRELGRTAPPAWKYRETAPPPIAACFVCFGRGGGGRGTAGDRGWAGAALFGAGRILATAVACGCAAAGYDPGHLALREGPLLESALSALPERPEVILVDATGRDHPRRAGLALHLGARLDVPSVGVTNRLLCATGDLPADEPRATCPFQLAGETVGYWVRTRRGTRPLAVHAGWRTDPQTALALVLACTLRARTPEPLRAARRVAREARTRAVQPLTP